MIKEQFWVDIHVNSKFIPKGMLQPFEPTIEEDNLFSFTHLAEALDNVHKSPISAKLELLKSC